MSDISGFTQTLEELAQICYDPPIYPEIPPLNLNAPTSFGFRFSSNNWNVAENEAYSWQSGASLHGWGWIEYGNSIAEAAQNLLHMLRNPPPIDLD
ncbi:hypothetical protein [Herpetosiphon llansteffanensis]|uniref:hypothetical protein n=1 Tax=Herpetosiphon llansteffanensis TaxID=2094568 RepID=UPI000F51A980|nr:hypothetical protein [Herpetosiphon llansteffanensis]